MGPVAPDGTSMPSTGLPRRLQDRIRALRLQLQLMAEGLLQGGNPSSMPGQGIEVTGVREYHAGDEVRGIDWRVTARRGRLHVKEFSQEREAPVLVILHLTPTLHAGRGGVKAVRALEASALLAALALQEGDRVGLVLTGQGGGRGAAPGRRRTQMERILELLLETPPTEVRFMPLAEALEGVRRATRERSAFFLVGDFQLPAQELPALRRALSRLRERHTVIPVRIRDDREGDLPTSGTVYLSDPWNGTLRRHPGRGAAEALRRALARNDEAVEETFRRLGLAEWTLQVGEPVAESLRRQMYRPRRGGGRLPSVRPRGPRKSTLHG